MQVTLEQGVVAGRVADVLVVAVRRELGVMAFAFTHEDVDLARFQYPIKAGQLAEVDLERMWTTFLTLFTTRTVTSAGFSNAFSARLAQKNVLGLRRWPFLRVDTVVTIFVVATARLLDSWWSFLFTDVPLDSRSIVVFILLTGPDHQTKLGTKTPVPE